MASVQPFRNPSGTIRYRVQYRIGGNGRQETFSTAKAADDFGALIDRVGGKAAKDVLDRRRNNLASTPTLAVWTERYLDPDSGILTGIEAGTREGYDRIARSSFLQVLGEYPVDAIEKADVGRWVAWQEKQPSGRHKGKPMAAKTVRNYHALLSNIMRAAVEARYRTDNPARGTRVSEGLAREAVFLSRDEFQALYAAIPDYYKPLVAFLVGTQTRWSEATALLGSDLHRDTIPPTVRVNKAWKKNPGGSPVISVPKSKRARRTISIWPELVDLVGTPPTPADYLFRGKLSGQQIWYGPFNTRIWRPAVLRSGIDKAPNIHDLRHTGASWLIADGQPLPFIQARLGHESITTTISVYGHLLPDAHTRMAASLSGAMSNVLPALVPIETA